MKRQANFEKDNLGSMRVSYLDTNTVLGISHFLHRQIDEKMLLTVNELLTEMERKMDGGSHAGQRGMCVGSAVGWATIL